MFYFVTKICSEAILDILLIWKTKQKKTVEIPIIVFFSSTRNKTRLRISQILYLRTTEQILRLESIGSVGTPLISDISFYGETLIRHLVVKTLRFCLFKD